MLLHISWCTVLLCNGFSPTAVDSNHIFCPQLSLFHLLLSNATIINSIFLFFEMVTVLDNEVINCCCDLAEKHCIQCLTLANYS